MERGITNETIQARADELRTWLIASAAFTLSSFVVLTNVSKPLELVGFMLLTHLIAAVPVFFAFYRAAVIDAVQWYTNTEACWQSHTPWCDGLLGAGGTQPAFVAYMLAFALSSHRLAVLYTTCAFSSFRFKLDGWPLVEFVSACILMLLALFFVALGKSARSTSLS